MSGFELLAGVVTLVVFVFLLFTLIRAEEF
ncbi:MAG: potassium-transporting ATPase subunit F [Candidatus Limnocylindrales bacterium]